MRTTRARSLRYVKSAARAPNTGLHCSPMYNALRVIIGSMAVNLVRRARARRTSGATTSARTVHSLAEMRDLREQYLSERSAEHRRVMRSLQLLAQAAEMAHPGHGHFAGPWTAKAD